MGSNVTRNGFIGVAACLFAACGGPDHQTGDGIHGELVSNGVAVGYDTYRSKPSMVENMKGSPGIASRIHINGGTVSAIWGGAAPDEWRSRRGSRAHYPQIDWADVVKQFEALEVDPKYEPDRHMVLVMITNLRDTPATMPLSPNDHRLSEAALRQADTELAMLAKRDDSDVLSFQSDSAFSGPGASDLAATVLHNRSLGNIATLSHRSWLDDRKKDVNTAVMVVKACANMHQHQVAAISAAAVEECVEIVVDVERMKNRGFKDRVTESGYEFKQVLDLYKAPALRTGWDHSGTRTHTFRHRKGTSDPWEHIGDEDTCNHGGCPSTEPKMRHYETCDSGVASDWYVVDGECHGDWFQNHFCNDDTSLQIAHASGLWTGDQCPGAKRAIAPHCGRQWGTQYDDVVR